METILAVVMAVIFGLFLGISMSKVINKSIGDLIVSKNYDEEFIFLELNTESDIEKIKKRKKVSFDVITRK